MKKTITIQIEVWEGQSDNSIYSQIHDGLMKKSSYPRNLQYSWMLVRVAEQIRRLGKAIKVTM